MTEPTFPLLIAHTPRAGAWNHVVLMPPSGAPAGADLEAYLSAVWRSDGSNYLAVSADVQQTTTGRVGSEKLILIGAKLPSGERLVALRAWLRARLDELGAVVAAHDWATHPGGPATLPQLAAWRDRAVAEFGLKPHTTTSRPLFGHVRLSRWAALSIGAFALTGLALLTAGLLRRYG